MAAARRELVFVGIRAGAVLGPVARKSTPLAREARMMGPRVVVPTLGRSPWLTETVASLGTVPGEVFFVTPTDAVAMAGPVPPKVVRVTDLGSGLYPALNAGFRAAGNWGIGTWINDDDRLVPGGFGQALALLESRPDLAAVFGRVALIDQAGRFLAAIPVARSGDDLGPLLAAGVIPLAQPGTLFRREVFDQLGGLDETLRLAGDMDFFGRALAAGFRFGFADAIVAEFRVHRGQLSQQAAVRVRETEALFAAARATGVWRRGARAARWRFRWRNLGVYVGRIRRHGWVSMESLQAHE
ncbi:MAG: glycosyltransferase [Opitutaceae bacterium]